MPLQLRSSKERIMLATVAHDFAPGCAKCASITLGFQIRMCVTHKSRNLVDSKHEPWVNKSQTFGVGSAQLVVQLYRRIVPFFLARSGFILKKKILSKNKLKAHNDDTKKIQHFKLQKTNWLHATMTGQKTTSKSKTACASDNTRVTCRTTPPTIHLEEFWCLVFPFNVC